MAARAAACGKVPENSSISVALMVVGEPSPAELAVLSPAVMLHGLAAATEPATKAAAAGLDEDGQSLIARVVPALSSCTNRPTCLPPTNVLSESSRGPCKNPFCNRYLGARGGSQKRKTRDGRRWRWGCPERLHKNKTSNRRDDRWSATAEGIT